ncbi:MAG: secretin N-terminal domain-containing protein, partial [Planctomycetota bacterium]
ENKESEEKDPTTVLTQGKIAVLDFLRYLQVTTGKVVNYPSSETDQHFAADVMIDVLGDIEPLSLPIVKALLEMNGYDLWEETLEDGAEIINVRHFAARVSTPIDPVNPIIAPGKVAPPEINQQLATLILQLKHADTSVVLQALRDLLDIQGAGRSTGTVKIVTVTPTQTLIIKSKVRILRHIQDLMRYIDVEVQGPEPIIQVRELYFADAQDIVSLIREILTAPRLRAVGATRTRQPAAGRGGQPASSSRRTGGVETATQLIADARTQKLIIMTTDGAELDLVHHLIDELDTKVRSHRTKTHIYKVKYLKAADLAENIRALVEGSDGSLRSRRTQRGGARGAAAQQVQQQQQFTPTRIVPHDETNSIIIQAEPEEYEEIVRILEQIDQKRRQVFLEVALVQVSDSSSLNYTLEVLAGNLDDQATRIAAMTAFGISGLDATQLPSNFARTFVGVPSTGVLAAVSRQGQIPAILRAIKTDKDTRILATPFILADDNQQNEISVQTQIFFETTQSTNVTALSGQDSEQAGITLSLLPTISREVVLLELNMEVSSFATASSSTGTVPDKSTNTITSRVTIPDGSLFIIGGLARENRGTVVDKVPILGDLPLIGRVFQTRATSHSRDNLYIFMSVHILDEEGFNSLEHLSEEARQGMRSFGEDIRVQNFTSPKQQKKGSVEEQQTEETEEPARRPLEEEQ